MKTAEEFFDMAGDEYNQWNYHNENDQRPLFYFVGLAMKQYAAQVAKDALNRAGECVVTSQAGDGLVIPIEWITETEIITP